MQAAAPYRAKHWDTHPASDQGVYPNEAPGHDAPVIVEYPEQLHHEASDEFAKYVKYGLLALGGAVGIGALSYWLYRKAVASGEEKKAFDTDSPTAFAKQIKQGLDNNNWPGADTATVRKAIVAIPDKAAMRKVSKSFNKLYGTPLGTALQDGLKTTEYTEMMAIIRTKPEKQGQGKEQTIYDPSAWAERLNAAVNYQWWGIGWGTDTEAIKQVFKEIPSQSAWQDVKDAYQNEYQVDAETDLDDDISSDEYDYRAVIAKKPLH